jgi:hypothetical protein
VNDQAKKPDRAPDPSKLEEKLAVTREALKTTVRATFSAGGRDGLRADQVQALEGSLRALGWLPDDAR